MKLAAALIAVVLLSAGAAHADSSTCNRSREYLLGGLGGDLDRPAQSYDDLFKVCVATAAMSNVKDAYILRDGGIAVTPKTDTVPATAMTLSQFCGAYPTATLRFLTRRELTRVRSLTAILQMSSTSSTSCKVITGAS